MKTIFLSILLLTAIGCQSSRGYHHNKHSHMKKMWMEMDTNKDEAVSKEEFDTAHQKMFKEMDANNDGKVTKEESKTFMQSQMKKMGCKSGCKAGDKAKCSDCKKKCDSGNCKLDKK